MERTLTVCFIFCGFLFVVNANSLLIMERIASYQRCKYDTDCKENAFCYGNSVAIEGNCMCKDGYYMDKNRTHYECLSPSGLNEPCTKNLQCAITLGPESLCTEEGRICQCNSGAHLGFDGYCYTTKKLTEVCQVNEECLLSDGTNAYCTDGHCDCPIKQHPADDLRHCVPSVNLGDPCDTDESCNHTYAACYTVCKCVPGYVTSRNEQKCLKAVGKFGDPCDEDVQCGTYLAGSICSNFICDCSIGYHGYGVSCYRDAILDEACADRRECVLTPGLEDAVDCLEGVCTCLTLRSVDGTGCMPVEGKNSARTFENNNIRVILVVVGVLWRFA